jgi:hypothetical protein
LHSGHQSLNATPKGREVEPFVSAERVEHFIQHVRNLKRFVIDDPA